MGSLFSKKNPPADYRFIPYSPKRLKIGPIDRGDGTITFGAVGSAQWFNPASASDRQLTTYDTLPPMVETDSLEALGQLRDPKDQFVVYQHWWPASPDGSRPLGAMKVDHVAPLVKAIKGGPIRQFMLVTGGFVGGAIRALGQQLQGHDLEYLGLFWYYSGDDITDDAGFPDEIAETCKALKVQRLSILTAAFNARVEEKLAQGLKGLKKCRVFEKDDAARYPAFRTPKLDSL